MLLGCQSPTSTAEKPIYVDQIYFEAFNACAEVYNRRFTKNITLISKPEKDLLNALLLDSTKLLITVIKPDSNWNKIFAEKGFSLHSEPVCFSALIGLSNTAKPFSPNHHPLVYQLKEDQNLQKQLSANLTQAHFGFDNFTALFDRLQVDSQAVGIIDRYTLQAFKEENGWRTKNGLSILPYQSETDTVYPNYDDIATGKYPFFRKVNFILKPNQITEEERFLRFLFEKEGQLILEKEGLIPSREFPKTLKFK